MCSFWHFFDFCIEKIKGYMAIFAIKSIVRFNLVFCRPTPLHKTMAKGSLKTGKFVHKLFSLFLWQNHAHSNSNHESQSMLILPETLPIARQYAHLYWRSGIKQRRVVVVTFAKCFDGYRLLLEYFCFCRKFCFVDVCGLDIFRLPENRVSLQ